MAKNIEIRNSTAEFLIFQIEGKENGVKVMYQRKHPQNLSGWFFRYYQIRRFAQKYDTACKTIFEI